MTLTCVPIFDKDTMVKVIDMMDEPASIVEMTVFSDKIGNILRDYEPALAQAYMIKVTNRQVDKQWLKQAVEEDFDMLHDPASWKKRQEKRKTGFDFGIDRMVWMMHDEDVLPDGTTLIGDLHYIVEATRYKVSFEVTKKTSYAMRSKMLEFVVSKGFKGASIPAEGKIKINSENRLTITLGAEE